MGGILSRGLLAAGVGGLVVVGCSTERDSHPFSYEDRLGTTKQAVFGSEMTHMGADLPEKTLVLTFDDGPSYSGTGGQTRAISTYLKGKGIKATFFMVGGCIVTTKLPADGCTEAADDADATIRQVIADGHLVANHTTTHRSMTSGLSDAQVVTDILETDNDLGTYAASIPWNQWFFRAPQGNWTDRLSTAADANGALKKYVGPIYWNAGGDIDRGREADWHCWPAPMNLSTKQCGDKYLTEIKSLKRGIVLMHDQEYGTRTYTQPPSTPNYDARGNTFLLVRYVVETLEQEGGWKYTTLDQVPSIKAAMPTCNASCTTCKGPTASDCVTCGTGKYLSAGKCLACTTCAAGTYASAACAVSADTTCTSCSTCPAGKREGTACSSTADTVCVDVPPAAEPDAGTIPTDPGPTPTGTATSSGGPTPGPDVTSPTVDGGASSDAAPAGSGCASAPSGATSPLGALAFGLGLLATRRRRGAACAKMGAGHPAAR